MGLCITCCLATLNLVLGLCLSSALHSQPWGLAGEEKGTGSPCAPPSCSPGRHRALGCPPHTCRTRVPEGGGCSPPLPPRCDSLKGDFSLLGHAGEIEQVIRQECGKESWVGGRDVRVAAEILLFSLFFLKSNLFLT